MKTESWLHYVPAVKRLKLKNIGVWKEAILEFSDNMNIITGGGGSGKSTILRSIAGAMSNNLPSNYLFGHKNSKIEINLVGEKLVCASETPTKKRKSAYEDIYRLPAGKMAYNTLSEILSKAGTSYALLLDNEATAWFDKKLFKKAFNLIRKTDGQKIIVIRQSFEIKNARIFECIYDVKKKSYKVVVQDV